MLSISSDNKTVKSVKKTVNYTPLSIVALLIAAVVIVLHTLLVRRYFEIDIALFETGVFLPKILYAAVAVYTVVCIFLGFLFQKTHQEKKPKRAHLTGISLYTGLLCGFAMIAAAVIYVLDIVRSGNVILFNTASDIVTAALIVCTIPAAAYFIISAFGGGYKNKSAIVCGMFTVIWMALLLLKLYFEMDVSLNSPTRILRQLAVISVMLYMLQELRYRIGIKRSALFRVFAALAVLFVGLSASSDITVMLRGGASDSVSTVFSYVVWCVGLYTVVNTFYIPSEEAVSGSRIGDEKKAVKERQRIREERDADNYLYDLLGHDNDGSKTEELLPQNTDKKEIMTETPDFKEYGSEFTEDSQLPRIIVPNVSDDSAISAKEFFESDVPKHDNFFKESYMNNSGSESLHDAEFSEKELNDGKNGSEKEFDNIISADGKADGVTIDAESEKNPVSEYTDVQDGGVRRENCVLCDESADADKMSISFKAGEEQDTDDFDTSGDMEYYD